MVIAEPLGIVNDRLLGRAGSVGIGIALPENLC